MAFLRKRASGNYALSWKWKGKSFAKGLGTKDLTEAEQIKQDAVDQLVRIRSAESALASELLADGHSIVDVLFGSEEIGHLIASPTDDNPPTISQPKEAFLDNLLLVAESTPSITHRPERDDDADHCSEHHATGAVEQPKSPPQSSSAPPTRSSFPQPPRG